MAQYILTLMLETCLLNECILFEKDKHIKHFLNSLILNILSGFPAYKNTFLNRGPFSQ